MKNRKMWLTAAFVCIALGVIVMRIGRYMGGHTGFYIDSRGLHTANEERDIEPVWGECELEAFDRMEIDVEYADVELEVSDRFAVKYCLSGEYGEPVCEVRNGKFSFKEERSGMFVNFGFFTSTVHKSEAEPHYIVKVEIPRGREFSEALLKLEYGDLSVDSLQSDKVEIENGYGSIDFGEFTGGKIKVELDSGDCRITRLDAADVEIENEYGDVILNARGDLEEYTLDLETEYGCIRAGNVRIEDDGYEEEIRYKVPGNGQKKIEISCDYGDIEVDSVS